MQTAVPEDGGNFRVVLVAAQLWTSGLRGESLFAFVSADHSINLNLKDE